MCERRNTMLINKLNKYGENNNIEVKKEVPAEHKKYLKSVVAFANGFGGKIIFGIEEKKDSFEICGLSSDVFKIKDSITNSIFSSIEPHIIPSIDLDTIEDKTILIVNVPSGWDRPYHLKAEGEFDGVYVRVSGTTRKADRNMIKELMFEGSNRYFDKMICPELEISENSIQNLCDTLYHKALENSKSQFEKDAVTPITKQDLLSWGILTQSNNHIVPTNAYALLTGHPALPNRIQCALFKGTDTTEVIDMKDYSGPIYEQIDFAYKFVLRNIRLHASFESLERKETYEIPVYAIRELIVNSIAHRSYIDRNSIKIAIFDDRLEVTSPGKLVMGQTIEKMKQGNSNIRNEATAYALRYLKYIENWGRGIPRIIKSIEECGLKPPVFIGGETELKVIIYRNNAFYKPNKKIGFKVNEPNGPNEPDIIQLIKINPKITQIELANQLNLSRSTIKRILNRLQQQEIVIRKGSNRNGYWAVKE